MTTSINKTGALCTLVLGVLAFTPGTSVCADEAGWKTSGDIRAGYFATESTARSGTESDDEAFNARIRLAVQRSFSPQWTFRTRLAGRFSSEQDGVHAYLRGYTPTPTGAKFGDITLDELWFGYRDGVEGTRWRIGRFQNQFALAGVASKGLDHNDSPNTDINWTDGVHLDVPVAAGWRAHAIVQHQSVHGSSSVARPPLDFSDSGSRASAFVGLRSDRRWGPVNERMLALTWMPKSLAPEGAAAPKREDYMVVTARTSAEWPLAKDGLRLVAGAELGYALNTPANAVMATGGSGDSDGLAWQVAASLYDMAPGHNFGAVYGQVGAGWLLSPDFRPNDALAEIRYQWRFSSQTSFEARVRERREIDIPSSAARARVDRDVYARISYKF